jgi:hypothetical protein
MVSNALSLSHFMLLSADLLSIAGRLRARKQSRMFRQPDRGRMFGHLFRLCELSLWVWFSTN